MTRPRVVAIGVATHDVIAVARDPLLPDGRILAEDMIEAGGGNAATAAVALARLEVPVAFIGRLGDDALGAAILAGLQREGVGVSGLRRIAGGRSPSSVIIVNPATAQRSIVTLPGAAYSLELDERELAACAAADWIHVDQAGHAAVRQLRRAGITTPVSLDAGNPVPDLDLSAIHLYAPTASALCRTMAEPDMDAALRRAVEAGPRMVAVTAGAQGSRAAVRENGAVRMVSAAAFHQPAILSTLGAGDVFHGALLAALVRGLPVAEALRYANAAAALSCRGWDGRSAIPARAELDAFLASAAKTG